MGAGGCMDLCTLCIKRRPPCGVQRGPLCPLLLGELHLTKVQSCLVASQWPVVRFVCSQFLDSKFTQTEQFLERLLILCV